MKRLTCIITIISLLFLYTTSSAAIMINRKDYDSDYSDSKYDEGYEDGYEDAREEYDEDYIKPSKKKYTSDSLKEIFSFPVIFAIIGTLILITVHLLLYFDKINPILYTIIVIVVMFAIAINFIN